MTTTNTYRKVQVYLIAFPEAKLTFEDPPMILSAPHFDAYPDTYDYEDEERVQDEAMRLADWVIETRPDLFGLPISGDEYDGYNQVSIDVAGEILEAIEGHTRREHTPENPRCHWRWVQDTELAPGVVVRAACFEYRSQP